MELRGIWIEVDVAVLLEDRDMVESLTKLRRVSIVPSIIDG